MAFAYYETLSADDQAIYRASDRLTLPVSTVPAAALACVSTLQQALEQAHRLRTQSQCRALLEHLCSAFAVPRLKVNVRAVRPSDDWGELHGLYEPAEGRCLATVSVWMRTAKQKRVVAFRTFLRTLVHEFCHHLDYELLKLDDSFHTEGFFKRESVLAARLLEGATFEH